MQEYKLLMQIVGIYRQEDFIELDNTTMTIDSINAKFTQAALRPWRFIDRHGVINLFPLNSKSIVRVIAVPIKEEIIKTGEPELVEERDIVLSEDLPKLNEQEAPKETEQERQDRLLAELVDKSNCLHEFSKLSLGYKETTQGKRYQPICNYCGHRLRYVGVQKIKEGRYEGTDTPWTVNDLVSAKILPEIN